MPTDYTKIIEEKDITFREFALRCAREIDYLFNMREESIDIEIPTEFLPDEYYHRKLEELCVECEQAEAMLPEEAERRAKEEYERKSQEYKELIERKVKSEERCRSLLEKVRMWQPPTPKHINLKDFMEGQLEEFMMVDCSACYCEKPKKQTGAEYKANLIGMLNQKIKFYKENYEQEVTRAEECTEWIKKLRESLSEDGA